MRSVLVRATLPTVIGLFAARFLAFGTRMVVTPFYVDIAHRFSLTLSDASAALTVFFVGYALTQLPIGYLADRVPPARLLVTGAVIEGALLVAFAVTPSWTLALVARFLSGCAASLLYTPVYKTIQQRVPKPNQGQVTGLSDMAVPASMIVTLSVFPVLSAFTGFWGLFFFLAAFALLPIALFARGALRTGPQLRGDASRRGWRDALGREGSSPVVVYVLIGALALAAVNTAVGWIPAYFEVSLGYPAITVGEILLFQLIMQMVGAYGAGFVSDHARGGSLAAIKWGAALLPFCVLGLAGSALWPRLWLVWAVAGFYGFGHGFSTLASVTYANGLWVKESGTLISLMNMVGQVLSIVALEGFAVGLQSGHSFTLLWVGVTLVAAIRLPLAFSGRLPSSPRVAARDVPAARLT